MFARQIVQLAAVLVHVVELPGLILLCHEFPLALPDRAVAFMLPEKRLAPRDWFAVKRREQTDTFGGLNMFAVELRRIFGAAGFETSRHQVDEMSGLRFELSVSRGANPFWPVHNQRGADAALVHPMFILAERCVAHVRP